jgi:4-diphosphocytidyl-2-C-methyl-D-erythritol kinase
MSWTRAVFVPAFAKINFTLEVLGRRSDGYHDLASVMQMISLHDTLALHPASDGEFSLQCDVEELAGSENLALRAAREAATACGVSAGVRIELRKETPVQAGLGGGSGDAAAVLLALPRLWGVELPLHHLTHIAATLGSDVPFFLTGGTALVSGRGERVAPLPDVTPLWIVVAKPAVSVPTGQAFAALTASDYADGSRSAALAEALAHGVAIGPEHLANSFAAGILRAYPAVADVARAFAEAGAAAVHLSGSGPTLFALFDVLSEAAPVWQRMRAGGHAVWLAHTIGRRDALAAVTALLEEGHAHSPDAPAAR